VARYEVAVDNHSNHPAAIRLTPVDPEDDLEFSLQRNEFLLQPGISAFVRMRVRPRRRFLRGQPRRHPFRVLLDVDDREPVVAEATMVQRQVLPKWLVPLLIALLAFALLLVTLYYTVLRPTINSAAKAEVAAQTGQLAAMASTAQQQASRAQQQASSAQQAAGGGGAKPVGPSTSAGGGGSNGTAANGANLSGGTATDFRIEADTPINASGTSFSTFKPNPLQPNNTTLAVTDIILQNPFGDTGLLRLQRGGSTDILFEIGLANFRDLDYHFVQPIVFTPDQPLEVSVACQAATAGPNDGKCHPAVSFSGRLVTNPPAGG
jgi:type II secretory pathway pseudopilin PulG